jgi:ABC-2 type transport system ATP-binding protein
MLIELDHVTKTYGKVVALKSLSVALPEGAIGLLGPNGAGKTTMIRALLGLITLDSGHGRVLGMDIAKQRLAIRQSCGFVPEDECLFPGMTGIEFVAYAGELVGMNSRDALRRAHEVLDYVSLGEARYRRVESYSTGMKQRLKVASAIVHDPRLLILDEPTNGMDPAGRDDMLELASDLAHKKEMSVLFSSHLLPDVEAVCDHVIVLGRGQLLAEGPINVLKESHHLQFEVSVKGNQAAFARHLAERGVPAELLDDHLLVQLPPDAAAATVWQAAFAAGEQIRSLRPRRSTLEEVFLKAVSERTDANL